MPSPHLLINILVLCFSHEKRKNYIKMKIPVDGKITHPELLILLKKKEENNI